MFKGHLSALAEYAQLPTKLLDVIDTVKQRLATHPSNGRYTLEEDEVFFFIVDDHSQPLNERKAEIHKKYLDVQIVLEGEERFGFSLHPFQSLAEDYLEERDLAFSEDIIDEQFVDLSENEFIIFDAEQPHRPLIAVESPRPIRKAVIKVAKVWLEG
ncbi:YhcH/YjgK/YiaL family protein [Vibrio cincinnatiensis]|uniref:YhcH/YjgK/YiaL family protein n=1 Tax=Vibrio cincinnatiensis TaxID=675 RepID=UPI001EDD0DE4|nr:YhcH/YjgK/YiaL family protein [Vibrio cincinnatiensis]MCG3734212.1 DUF386 family protein [Vibrio cincinnatiensis]MCG3741351.1 DUF386 family protein [Vibrio cincinnatiensis]MCG3745054.1 DUF386 family protein [Vibrio cincinnatiensis]